MRQVADAVKSNNRNAGGALLRSGQQALPIRGSGLIRSSEDIENIVLDAPKGVPIFVRDIGRVQVGTLPQTGIFAMDDSRWGPEGVEGIVLMRRGENPSEVLPRVPRGGRRAERDAAAPGRAARGDPRPHRPGARARSTPCRTSSSAGFVIVVTVLLVFLLSVRAALLTARHHPAVAALRASCACTLSGVSLSLLSIGALDFGIIVDGTIVMVERIIHALGERRGDRAEHPGARSPRAALAVQRPILFSLVIIIAAYIPLLTLERVERRLFTPMALTVCYALLGLAAAQPDPDSRARDVPVPRPSARSAGIDRSRRLTALVRTRGRLAWSTTPAWTVAAAGRRRRGAVYLGSSPRDRVPPAARRGRHLDPGQPPGGDLAREVGRDGRPDARADPAVARRSSW